VFNEELKRIDVFLESENKNVITNIISENLLIVFLKERRYHQLFQSDV
jgi:hypothetical protein